ncbi:MAG: cation diffusion facilitator family transporter [Dehalococcoidia bacterium]
MSEHHHHDAIGAGTKLKYGIIITCVILALEVAGGIMSNSLALLSDAGHVLADGIALLLSWWGIRQAERPPSSRMTFGYHRVGVIIAIVNAVSILAISGIILYEAYERFFQHPVINSAMMLVIAAIGLAANVFVALWLRKEQGENINIRSAYWHAAGDALASVGVIIGAIVIMATGLYWVDAAVSILISIIILVSAFGIFREGLRILLEGVPHDIDISEVVNTIKSLPEIRDVHDIHVWSIASRLRAMSSHVVVDDCYVSEVEAVRRKIEVLMLERFGIGHTTIQVECGQCGKDELYCKLTPEAHSHDADHEDHRE